MIHCFNLHFLVRFIFANPKSLLWMNVQVIVLSFVMGLSQVVQAKTLAAVPSNDSNQASSSRDMSDSSSWSQLSFADTKLGVINQLRSINEQARQVRLKLNSDIPLRNEELTEELQKASLGRELAQSLEVSFRLSRLLNRPNVGDSAAYTQLLEALGLSMIDIGLERLGYERLLQYLKNGQSTPREYESMLFAYLDTAQKQMLTQDKVTQTGLYSFEILQKLWRKYQSLCKRFKRLPNPAARYMIAKHFYFLRHFQEAQAEIKMVSKARGYRLRALYILGVIYLEQGDWENAKSHFLSLEGFLNLNPSASKRSSQKSTLDPSQKDSEKEQDLVKLIHTRPRLKVTQIRATNKLLTKQQAQPKAQAQSSNELSPDLMALLDEVSQEKNFFTQRTSQSLGKAPRLEQKELLKELALILQMTLARLTLLQGKYTEAWQRYRQIPVGSVLYVESLLEAAYSMRMRQDYVHAAHLLQQAIDEYPSSEAAVELKLTRAKMLVKSGQYETGKQLYQDLEQELKKQLIVVKNAQKSSLLFPPEVQAWLPTELAQRTQRFASMLREQRLWLDQAKDDLSQLSKAYQTNNYPALNLADQKIKGLQKILAQRLKNLPKLIKRWAQTDMINSKSKRSQFKQVNRGLVHNQNHPLNQIDSSTIEASATQLQKRLMATLQEITVKRQFYHKNLARLVKNEQRAFNRAQSHYQALEKQLSTLSQQAQQYAYQKLEKDLAQLTLGPSLSDFWEKERASERLEKAQTQKFYSLGMLSRLQAQESNAPQLQLLNLLDPVIKSFIIDPLPDTEKVSNKQNQVKRKRFRRLRRRRKSP